MQLLVKLQNCFGCTATDGRFFFLVDLIWVAAATFTLKCGGGPHSQAARSTDRIVIQSTDRVPVEMAATRQQQAQTEMLVEGHSE